MFCFDIRYLILHSIPAAAGCFSVSFRRLGPRTSSCREIYMSNRFKPKWDSNFTTQSAPPSIQTCLHTRRLNVQLCFSKLTTRNKLSIPSQTFTHTVLMGAEMTAHSLPGKNTLPFLSAFHHKFLIGSNELEFGRMLPHALQTLPHRGHVSLGAGSFSAPIPP